MVSVGPGPRRKLPRKKHGREREEKREEVAEHMHSVGDEGERAREVAAGHLDSEDEERDQDRGPEG